MDAVQQQQVTLVTPVTMATFKVVISSLEARGEFKIVAASLEATSQMSSSVEWTARLAVTCQIKIKMYLSQ